MRRLSKKFFIFAKNQLKTMELDKTLKPYSCNLFAWQIDALRALQQQTDIGVQVHVRNALTVFLNKLNKV